MKGKNLFKKNAVAVPQYRLTPCTAEGGVAGNPFVQGKPNIRYNRSSLRLYRPLIFLVPCYPVGCLIIAFFSQSAIVVVITHYQNMQRPSQPPRVSNILPFAATCPVAIALPWT